ncbi:DUF6134 family protein [Algoriphagus sp.]|uniref:DUF6134 family protein n=1 Tax=Algoriphagus sp. TaxID=1872435 RepID=UPI003918720B
MSQNLLTSTMGVAAASQRLALLFVLFVLAHQTGFGQGVVNERHYEISVLGFNIGEMTANRSKIADSTVYKVKSNVSFWFLGKVNVDFRVDTRLAGNQIVWAKSNSSSNKGDFNSEIKWNGKFYDVDASTYKFENKKSINEPVALSSAMLFFNEPKDNQALLGEAFGLVSRVKKLSATSYEVTINGNTNRYYYENGVMVKAEMQSPIKNYVIKLVK